MDSPFGYSHLFGIPSPLLDTPGTSPDYDGTPIQPDYSHIDLNEHWPVTTSFPSRYFLSYPQSTLTDETHDTDLLLDYDTCPQLSNATNTSTSNSSSTTTNNNNNNTTTTATTTTTTTTTTNSNSNLNTNQNTNASNTPSYMEYLLSCNEAGMTDPGTSFSKDGCHNMPLIKEEGANYYLPTTNYGVYYQWHGQNDNVPLSNITSFYSSTPISVLDPSFHSRPTVETTDMHGYVSLSDVNAYVAEADSTKHSSLQSISNPSTLSCTLGPLSPDCDQQSQFTSSPFYPSQPTSDTSSETNTDSMDEDERSDSEIMPGSYCSLLNKSTHSSTSTSTGTNNNNHNNNSSKTIKPLTLRHKLVIKIKKPKSMPSLKHFPSKTLQREDRLGFHRSTKPQQSIKPSFHLTRNQIHIHGTNSSASHSTSSSTSTSTSNNNLHCHSSSKHNPLCRLSPLVGDVNSLGISHSESISTILARQQLSDEDDDDTLTDDDDKDETEDDEYYGLLKMPRTQSRPTKQQSAQAVKKTRMGDKGRNVDKACQHCKRSHLRCDNVRPCGRCVATGKTGCEDVHHKPRGRPRLPKNRDKPQPRTFAVIL
ncbi:hypothetical protein F4703DRAFT_1927354 [Phycomyces blakesleeanus]